MIPVRYLPVAGFAGYHIGDDGSVWSARLKNGNLKEDWHRLSTSVRERSRYATVCFRAGPCGSKGKSHVRYVHRLVLEAFVGPCPEGMECRHLDGNPRNNRVENLRWGTHRENRQDMERHGTKLMGERCHSAKMNETCIRAIRHLHDQLGLTQNELAAAFGLTQNTVYKIVNGETWKHV